jgi:hypothetical protein
MIDQDNSSIPPNTYALFFRSVTHAGRLYRKSDEPRERFWVVAAVAAGLLPESTNCVGGIQEKGGDAAPIRVG